MSDPSADELRGWFPSPCMTTSTAAGAKRFIGASERGFRSVDLEKPGSRSPRSPCMRGGRPFFFWGGGGVLIEPTMWLGSAQIRVESCYCGMTVSHNEERRLDSARR